MKTLLFSLLFCLSISLNAQTKLTKLWETKDLPTPESVLQNGNWLYVSLIDGDASYIDYKGGIALLNQSGIVVNKEWIKGLNAPKGMAIYKDIMYVADIDQVVKIDVKTARILKRIKIENTVFLNDVTADNKGNIFVSDTRLGNIYKISDDKPELYMSDLKAVNGLKSIKSDLFVLSGPTFLKVDKDKKITNITDGLAAGGDGLEPYKEGWIASCWVGLIYHIKKDGSKDLLLDTRESKYNTADIGFNPKTNVLYVPTFLKNSVVAYQVD